MRHTAAFRSTLATVSTTALLIASLCAPTLASAAESSETPEAQATSHTQLQAQSEAANNGNSSNTTADNGAESTSAESTESDSESETGTPSGTADANANPDESSSDQPSAQADTDDSQNTATGNGSASSDDTDDQTSTGAPDSTEPDANATPEQQLDALAAAHKGTIAPGEYTISAAANTNFVLDVSAGSHANGANVQIYRDNASPAQRWQVSEDANGYLTLTNAGSGKVLDVYAADSRSGANVDQWEANGSRAQKWIAISENGHITLRSALVGDQPLALDIYAARTASGVNVQSYAANGTGAQQWNFEKILDMSDQVRSYWNRHLALGRPTNTAQVTPTGIKQTFQHGVTYQWGNKVIGVSGNIYAKYASLGAEQSRLGVPVSSEMALRGGQSQAFQNGQIHWSQATGAHITRGAIQDYWGSQSWENGWLGYPTGDEIAGLRDGGSSQTFQGGVVFWSQATGAHGVGGAILNDYAARRYEAGSLGYPVNEEHDWNKGRAQDFQHGTLTWAGCGKKGWQNPAQYFQVSSCDVGVPANGMFGYASPSRISMSATREQAIEAMISRAYDYLGTRYVWDYALQPGVGVDCAGLVMQSLYAAGMDLHEYNPTNHWYDPWHSHDANNMAADSRFKHVSLNERQRGDLIYWPGHIAIYLGNDQIIEANVPAVRINSLWAYGTPGGALRPFV